MPGGWEQWSFVVNARSCKTISGGIEQPVFFFIALVFYFLNKDELRFGKYFWLAAVAVDLRSEKLQGLFSQV